MKAISAERTIHPTAAFAGNADFVAMLEKLWPFPAHPRRYEDSLVAQVAALFHEAG